MSHMTTWLGFSISNKMIKSWIPHFGLIKVELFCVNYGVQKAKTS